MSEDRELLERAARAAGIGGGWDWPRGAKSPYGWRGADKRIWDPLTDDGDALRLAVKLDLLIVGKYTRWMEVDEYIADPLAATRRAIVRAAASLCPSEDKRNTQ